MKRQVSFTKDKQLMKLIMKNNIFIFRKDTPYRQLRAIELEAHEQLSYYVENISEDFQFEFKSYSKRSQKSLAAYWVLINSIVEWSNEQGNSYTDKYFDESFKKEAGLTEEVDNMAMWKMRYHDKIKKGWELYYWADSETYSLMEYKDGDPDGDVVNWVDLGPQYIHKTRSVANKGDITKQEMERLIECVLEFGKDIPNCKITDLELERLLKFYERGLNGNYQTNKTLIS